MKPDSRKALEILKSSGWQDSDGDGVLDKMIDGSRKPLKLSVTYESADQERWVSLFQSDLQKLGISVELNRIVEDNQSWQRLKDGRFELWATSKMTFPSAGQSFKTDNYYNFYGYSNVEVDKLLTELQLEFDIDKRNKIYKMLIELVRSDDFAIAGLVTTKSFFGLAPHVNIHAQWPFQPIYWTDAAVNQ